jgi:iron complex outermembrane recepter protein
LLLPTPVAQGIAANLNPALLEETTNYSETESFDIFADATFQVTDRFEIGGGIRYTMDDKRTGISSRLGSGRSIITSFQYALGLTGATQAAAIGCLATPGASTRPVGATCPVPLFGLSAGATPGNGSIVYDDHDDSGLTWRAVARYAVSDDASIYANYARGRRPEVLQGSAPGATNIAGTPAFRVIDAETVDSFELGFKTSLGRDLFFDSALFYYDYSNFQTTVQVGTAFETVNAGKAESYGYEGQLRWEPTSWVRLLGTYAYNHSRFSTGARDGNRFRLSPDHSASLAATFTAPVGAGRVDFTPSVTYQSQVFFDDDNDRTDLQATGLIPDLVVDEYQDGYALVNARLGYEFGNPGIRIEAFVDNLFDESYIKDAGNTGDGLGLPTFISGEPRTYGVQASVRF